MIKVGVIGSTGYAGQELVRLLLRHPDVKITFLSSKSYAESSYADVFPNFYKKMNISCISTPKDLSGLDIDLLFTALPHGHTSGMMTSNVLEQFKVIDLGADFRLKEQKTYEDWYHVKHESPELLPLSVYGLCEINREEIAKSQLIANPGCYTTCSILAIMPLLKASIIDPSSVIIDAKSGVTGAGRGLDLSTHYTECNESIKAYKIASHRHTPEIEEQLSLAAGSSITINFTPHLVPMNRGILCTSYANLKTGVTYDLIKRVYEKHYGNEPFIRLLPDNTPAETRWIKGSNCVDIGFSVDLRTNRVIVTSALDNLIKGAAGQAIQNMNIAFNIKETTGLDDISIFPI